MPESNWWTKDYGDGQAWGATNYAGEPPGHGKKHWHAGQDWQLPMLTPIYAPVDCRLVFYGEEGYGDSAPELALVGRGGVHILLGHMESITSRTIDHIYKAGSLIGYSGTKGHSSGPHLHFEARVAPYHYLKLDIDPTPYLKIAPAVSAIKVYDEEESMKIDGHGEASLPGGFNSGIIRTVLYVTCDSSDGWPQPTPASSKVACFFNGDGGPISSSTFEVGTNKEKVIELSQVGNAPQGNFYTRIKNPNDWPVYVLQRVLG